MGKIDKALSNVFGVEQMYPDGHAEGSTSLIPVPVASAEDRAIQAFNDPDATDLDQDASLVRSNLHAIINEGQSAFEVLINIAKTEEKVSAFEIANQMLANLTAINMSLLKVHEQKRKMKMADKKQAATENPSSIVNNGGTTNIAFMGSSRDLMNHLKNTGLIEDIRAELPSEEELDADEDDEKKG